MSVNDSCDLSLYLSKLTKNKRKKRKENSKKTWTTSHSIPQLSSLTFSPHKKIHALEDILARVTSIALLAFTAQDHSKLIRSDLRGGEDKQRKERS